MYSMTQHTDLAKIMQYQPRVSAIMHIAIVGLSLSNVFLLLCYSYCYVYVFLLFIRSVLYFMFLSCQLAFSDYPD